MSGEITIKEQSIVYKDLDISVGDVLHYSDNVYTITGFGENKHGKYIVHDGYEYNDSGIGTKYLSEIKSGRDGYYKILKKGLSQNVHDIADRIISGDFNINELGSLDPQESSSNSLMVVDSNLYKNALADAENARNKMEVIKTIIRKKTEVMRRSLDGILSVHYKMVKRLNSIVFTLELYAGIKESIKQIQSGNPAEDSEPIHLSQLMRYMDEEVGDPDNGGVSYDSIDKFDNWLLSYSKHLKCFHYELMLPQKKCVRTIRVRRSVSERYSSDPFNNRWEIDKELQTYILIRNGENIYTIQSEMNFKSKLFPDVDELTRIMANDDDDKRYDSLEGYKNGMILIQGLIDRTTVFGNIFGKVSVLSPKSSEEGKVIFKYEMDDNLLGDGKKTFLNFLQTDDIKVGDRIILREAYVGENGERLMKWYNKYNIPYGPEEGVYKIEKHYLHPHVIMYKVRTYYDGGYKKNKLAYKIYPNRDHNIVNIDRVSHRDIEWLNNMLYDRKDRKNYLRVFGLLKDMKHYKNKELALEKPFAQMIQSHCKVDELTALDLVHWWKTKNKHKRAISVDDQKAFRMITKEAKRINKV